MIKLFVAVFLIFSKIWGEETLIIGSKRFTESYILGEILFQTAKETGEAQVSYKSGLGNTGVLFEALRMGAIDLYPEYTGTIYQEILKIPMPQKPDLQELNDFLTPLGLGVGLPFGFTNSYALAIPKELADRLKIDAISDLNQYPELKYGLSQEFMKRRDGWEALKKAYGLLHQNVIGIDHSLGYEAISHGKIDLMDVYVTDPKIEKYQLRLLKDDREFFPLYDAVLFYRLEIPKKLPKIWEAFKKLENKISNHDMTNLNHHAEMDRKSFFTISSNFLNPHTHTQKEGFLGRLHELNLWRLTLEHLSLVFGSLIPAILVGVPLGILALNVNKARSLILNIVAIIQTIPALALLVFLVPILRQIGVLPALIALFLYALLPIVRNTYAGLNQISEPLKESAKALGLPWFPRLIYLEIPLASETILTGIKTAAVVNAGMASIAALVGAGGYGELIIPFAKNNVIF